MFVPQVVSLSILMSLAVANERLNPKEIKCLVCQRVVEEMEKEIDKVDPKKIVDVGSYRIDHKGNQRQKVIEYRRSEVFLTELMEKVCNRMDDYARARLKSNGRLVVIPLTMEGGGMNPMMSEVDFIQDSDLNKSLKFYCEGILEEFEEGFVKAFSQNDNNLDIKLCSQVAQLCDQTLEEDYDFEREEL